MIRVDPASPEFVRLPKQEQAMIYYFDFGWTVPSIADELDEGRKTVGRWLDDSVKAPAENKRASFKAPRTKEEYAEKFKEVISLYEQGVKPPRIVELVKLHRSCVYRVLSDHFGPASSRKAAA